jgi:hypothetical protein
LAARLLPERDNPDLRKRIKLLLDGSDPVVRAHLAAGLARDPEPDAVTLLVNAYRYEEDALVRRAIVRALSRRPEVQRKATLALARDLDPDEGVRSLARAAESGRALDVDAFSASAAGAPRSSVAWISFVPNDAKPAAVSHAAARVLRPDGLAIPVVADPDGVLIVPGLPPGASALAPAPGPGDARRP